MRLIRTRQEGRKSYIFTKKIVYYLKVKYSEAWIRVREDERDEVTQYVARKWKIPRLQPMEWDVFGFWRNPLIFI